MTQNHKPSEQDWSHKVLQADKIWEQVKKIFDDHNSSLNKTPRAPDVRAILRNNSGHEIRFLNPGGHSDGGHEVIPSSGDETSVMIMLEGSSLEEQYANANHLFKTYNLHENGLSDEFTDDLKNGKLSEYIREAYGPAPYEKQVERLEDISWEKHDGEIMEISKMDGANGSFGVRPPQGELVFKSVLEIYMQGTVTTAELIENEEYVGIDEDWQTGEIKTRPIAASVAPDFYGRHTDSIPEVRVHVDGSVASVELSNGQILFPRSSDADLNHSLPVNEIKPH